MRIRNGQLVVTDARFQVFNKNSNEPRNKATFEEYSNINSAIRQVGKLLGTKTPVKTKIPKGMRLSGNGTTLFILEV